MAATCGQASWAAETSQPGASAEASLGRELTFERDVRPIFRTYCFDCHGATEQREGGLDLRLVRTMQSGGESGPAIVPGDVAASYLIQRVVRGEMPPGKHRVSEAEIETLRAWVSQGAPTARPEPEELGRGLSVTPEERAYWAFRPIQRPQVAQSGAESRVRTAIDALLWGKMARSGLGFSADAPPATLVRRAYLDLLGMLPTPEATSRFVADPSDAQWERLIDELLASPRYGERWGRHWLDVAGYAESEGDGDNDAPRPWAYKYRDFVIRAFNGDMPFDEFIVWQLAGDELATPPFKNLDSLSIDQLTATGFLRMAADPTASDDSEETRNAALADTIKIVGSAFLGLSVGCAQCHDHRYDPISHEDYHRLRAVFEPALNYRQWRTPRERLVSLATDADAALAAQFEEEARPKREERAAKQAEFMEAALQGELAKAEEALRQPLADAYRAAAQERTPAQRALLADYPNIASLSPGVLYQYNQGHADALKELDRQIGEILAKIPPPDYLHCLTEARDDLQIPETRLFHRGDYRQPKHEVAPGGMEIESPEGNPLTIPADDPQLASTGRRLAYARWLTSGRHPLTARVLANRIWLNHFGKGLVDTPDEFGKLGLAPSHPELLDWLADEFMASGWSLKHMHRLIMRSTVYRQSSAAGENAQSIDASNELYARFPLRRLDAEAIRDAILATADRLDETPFGRGSEPTTDATGQVVVEGDRQRRSVYIQTRRSQPMTLLQSFDAPVMRVNCAVRTPTTSASQSLLLMNSDFVWKFAEAFAQRVAVEAPPTPIAAGGSASPESAALPVRQTVAAAVARAWRLAYCRAPTPAEIDIGCRFVNEQADRLRERGSEAPERQALANLCQALLSSNEFLYMD